MQKKCSSALLLSDVESFAQRYKVLAEEFEVRMRVEKDWNEAFRIKEEVVICGSKYLDCINTSYYPLVVLILKEDESFIPYMNEYGITRFIFDYKSTKELVFAFVLKEKIVVNSTSVDLKNIIKESNITSFIQGDYRFLFDKNKFWYKEKPIYLSVPNKKYLAEWLLNGNKDNNKRMSLYNLRKKFGEDFLRDIDRFGQLKEKKDE